MTKYELAAIQPSHCSWQIEGHSPGPPAVQPLSIFVSFHEPASLKSVCKCIIMVQTTWGSCWTTCKALSVFWLKKPARQTPGMPCSVGSFLCPPHPPYTGLSPSLPGEEQSSAGSSGDCPFFSHSLAAFCKIFCRKGQGFFLLVTTLMHTAAFL